MTKNRNEARMKATEMNPSELVEKGWMIVALLYASMPDSHPAAVLAGLFGLSPNTTQRWAREPLSDESATTTGSRWDWDRFWLVYVHLIVRHAPELAQAIINGMQLKLDQALAEAAQVSIERIQNPKIRKAAMREIQKNQKRLSLRDAQPR